MSKENIIKNLKDKPYRKPEIKKQLGMVFPEQIMKDLLGATGTCKQCTSCHGCR